MIKSADLLSSGAVLEVVEAASAFGVTMYYTPQDIKEVADATRQFNLPVEDIPFPIGTALKKEGYTFQDVSDEYTESHFQIAINVEKKCISVKESLPDELKRELGAQALGFIVLYAKLEKDKDAITQKIFRFHDITSKVREDCLLYSYYLLMPENKLNDCLYNLKEDCHFYDIKEDYQAIADHFGVRKISVKSYMQKLDYIEAHAY